MKSSSRMMLNTAIMYGRYIITMFVSLCSSRWILMALGAEDFGIFSLVAGLLAMLMFFNVSLASSTQRFLSYALGSSDEKLLKDTFMFSKILHLAIGFCILLLIQLVGLFLLHNFLQIPEGKMELAEFVLTCLSISTFFTVISVPYNAALLTHENILFISIVQIGEALLKLSCAVYLLQYDGQKLKFYAVCMMIIPIVSMALYRIYCLRNYHETKQKFYRVQNNVLIKKILAYSGWNLIGSVSSLCRTQGVSMLLNSFFGVIINTAYGIATQVNGQLSFLSQAILTAAKPQIVKSEGMGNRRRMIELSETTSKVSFLLFACVAIPLIVEMPFILKIWLKNVPDYTITFTRLVILLNLVAQFSKGISVSIESVGNIRLLQLIVGGLHFLVLPIGFVLIKFGMPPHSVFIAVIMEELIGLVLRSLIAHHITGVSLKELIVDVTLPSWFLVICVFIFEFFLSDLISHDLLSLFCVVVSEVALIVGLSYLFVLTRHEKEIVNSVLTKIKIKVKKK